MNLIDELRALQETKGGWLPDEDLRDLAERLRVPLYEVEGVVSFYPHFRREPPRSNEVAFCRDVSCRLAGSDAAGAAVRAALTDRVDVGFEEVSCLGRCDMAPACTLNDSPMTTADVVASIDGRAPPGDSRPRRAWRCDPYADDVSARYSTVRALVRDGELDGVTGRLNDAGLRGRGGAGFPAGVKWEAVRDADAGPGGSKYVICNADESEPGTFKDRVILDELPHLVIEGMVIAGLCSGATEGIVYVRHEYGPETGRLAAELAEAERLGVLGEDAAGSGKAFSIRIFVSAGGYVLGEETALLEALEGRRGEPRNKPPLPVHNGLFGQPTVINNVETLAMVPYVVREGRADLKFYSVSGDVERPQVIEAVAAETTLNGLVDACGGMRDGAALLAFIPGGSSTPFLGAVHATVVMDAEPLREAGSALGSAAIIVIGEGRDLRELAANVAAFFRNESCGKCVPCRIGTEKAVALIESEGEVDLATLRELHETLAATSICGLGQAALVAPISALEMEERRAGGR